MTSILYEYIIDLFVPGHYIFVFILKLKIQTLETLVWVQTLLSGIPFANPPTEVLGSTKIWSTVWLCEGIYLNSFDE